ncbi:MGMT family protein [Neisseria sp. Ec49-e6-T10]|uniref:MGMT family protein n=1 Tax=Neisseria sp. Ec49-e6-T10 TaxID=3140744 RepID=UPI003EB82D3C
MQDSFPTRVYQILAAIPKGKVATYGTIARLASSPRAARQVGGILKRLPKDSTLPWHRVVNRFGKISMEESNYIRQKECLLKEGILFDENDCIDLTRFGWAGDD